MEKVYIVGYKRSPFTKYMGKLKDINLIDFSSNVLTHLINDSFLDVKDINEVLIGNVLSANQGMNIARQIAIKSGIPNKVVATTVNMVCGSGMKTVIDAFYKIKYAHKDLIITGGVESMSNAPIYKNYDKKEDQVSDIVINTLINDGLKDAFYNRLMGELVEKNTKDLNISRDEQEMFSYQSQLKAINASKSHKFFEEIVPIEVDGMYFDKDECIHPTPSLEKMKTLKPIFDESGTITAATSSVISDGASFIALASETYAKKHNLHMIAEVVDVLEVGVEPSLMGLAPADAIVEMMNNNNLKLQDIDLFEINEAFASQVLGVVNILSNNDLNVKKEITDRLNLYGGAIALGHPLGSSGSRITGSLAYQLNHMKKRYGIASLCIGGGMATAVLLKK